MLKKRILKKNKQSKQTVARKLITLTNPRSVVSEQETDIEGLHLITSGPIPPNPAELLGSKTMDTLIDTLKENYDLLIFDAPPVLSVTDAQILSNKAEGTILVLNAGTTEKDSALKAKEALVSSQANILGTILNNFILQKDHYYYQYYGNEE